eukprot:1765985-Amphidinium_carterae.1
MVGLYGSVLLTSTCSYEKRSAPFRTTCLAWVQRRKYCVLIPFRTQQKFSNKYKKQPLVDTILLIFPWLLVFVSLGLGPLR